MAGGGLPPGLGAAEAEPDSEDGHVTFFGAEVLDCRSNVGGDALRRRLLHVRAPLEALVPGAVAGRPAEVIDGHGVDAGLREALGKLLVEAVQPTPQGPRADTCP